MDYYVHCVVSKLVEDSLQLFQLADNYAANVDVSLQLNHLQNKLL